MDFDHTGYAFLEEPWWLALVLALAVASYGAERLGANEPRDRPSATRGALRLAMGVLAAVFGALLFAGTLEDGGRDGLPGLVAGALCGGVAWLASSSVFEGARSRLEAEASRLVPVFADAAALVAAGAAILFPPLGLLVLVSLLPVLVRYRRGRDDKYEGLRILR